jgi:O-antigen ligase
VVSSNTRQAVIMTIAKAASRRSPKKMRKLFLLSLFLALMMGEMLGLDLSFGRGLSVKNLYLYILLVSLVLEAAITRQQYRVAVLDIHLGFWLLLFYACVSWFWTSQISVLPDYSAIDALGSLKGGLFDHYFVFLAFLYGVRSHEDALWVAKYVLWIVIIANGATLIDVLDIPDLGLIHERADGRVSGPLGESNQYGAFLTMFLPSLAVAAWLQRGGRRLAYVTGFVLSAVLLLLTASRGAFVGLVGGLIIVSFYAREWIRPARLLIITAFLTLVVAITAITVGDRYSELLYERLIEKSTEEDLTTASSGRTEIWSQGLRLQMEKPITFLVGYGWDTYRAYQHRASHNVYLGFLFELGVIGLGLYLFIVARIFNFIRKAIPTSASRPHLVAFLVGFSSVLVSVFFVNLYEPWLFVWAYTGLMMQVAAHSLAPKTSALGSLSGAAEFGRRHGQAIEPASIEAQAVQQHRKPDARI